MNQQFKTKIYEAYKPFLDNMPSESYLIILNQNPQCHQCTITLFTKHNLNVS